MGGLVVLFVLFVAACGYGGYALNKSRRERQKARWAAIDARQAANLARPPARPVTNDDGSVSYFDEYGKLVSYRAWSGDRFFQFRPNGVLYAIGHVEADGREVWDDNDPLGTDRARLRREQQQQLAWSRVGHHHGGQILGAGVVGFVAGAAWEHHHQEHQQHKAELQAQFDADMDKILHPPWQQRS